MFIYRIMKLVTIFEDFKVNNITQDDLIKCIKTGGFILTSIVEDLPEHDPKKELYPRDISDDGNVTVEINGKNYLVDLDDIERVEMGVKESKKISILDEDIRKELPKKLTIVTSNGEFELQLCDCWIQFPKMMFQYWHNTPEKTDDVLADGEPDYLSFDLNFMKREDTFEINVENTYGDAMMFEYKITPPNTIEVGHYNGYKSKHDPKYVFTYTEDSIKELMNFFNKFTFGVKLTRDKFNFLDIDPNSYKLEKVGYVITNFSKF